MPHRNAQYKNLYHGCKDKPLFQRVYVALQEHVSRRAHERVYISVDLPNRPGAEVRSGQTLKVEPRGAPGFTDRFQNFKSDEGRVQYHVF